MALRRAGAFNLLITQNASRLSNGTTCICVEDLDNILIVTDLVKDPNLTSYDYDAPCPDTPTRSVSHQFSTRNRRRANIHWSA